MKLIDMVKKYLTYQVLTGRKYERSELVSYIKTLPVKHLIGIITQLGAFPEKIDDPVIRAGFISFLKTKILMILPSETEVDIRLSEYVLYTPQGLLNVCKWLFAYGDFDKEEPNISVEKGIIQVLYLCIIVSDFMGNYAIEKPVKPLILPEQVLHEIRLKRLPYEVLRNIVFNRTEDVASAISRTLFITTNIFQNESLFAPNEFVDGNTNFERYYKYTVLDYISVLFVLFILSQNDNRIIKLNNFSNIEQIFQHTSLFSTATIIARELTLPVKEAKKWALNTLNETWDVSLLAQKPLLTFDGTNYIPLLPRMFTQDIFIKLKIKFENSFEKGKKRRKFTDFWGRPFEKYVEWLAKEVCNGCTCEFIPEFEYSGKRSPDVILRLNDKIIAVEAKARYLRTESIFTNSISKVDEDINRMVIEPLKQVHDRINELRQLNKKDLQNVNEIFLVSVTMGEFPVVPKLEERIKTELDTYFKMSVKGYAHVSIEEYELLCGLIERGENIFDIMSKYSIENRQMGFRDFLITNGFCPGRPNIVTNIFTEKAALITETVGLTNA